MTVTLTYHGHATLSLHVNGTHVLVDPFFTGNPSALTKADDVQADYILLTHGHGDHVGDTLSIAKRTKAMVVANFEIADWINAQGHDKAHGQHIGGGYQHGFGHVKFVPAWHGSGLPDGSYGGTAAGLLLTLDDKKVYIAGDTALFSDMGLIGNAGIDLAVLPIGDNYTMGPDDALLALGYLKPKVVVPYHYNTWPPIEVDAEAWVKRVATETECKPIMMKVDESLTV